MFELLAWLAPAVGGAIYLLMPFVVRSSFRLAARCNPEVKPLDCLPVEIAAEIQRRIGEFSGLGFELTGIFDCGALASGTRSYVAYFCNHTSNEFANVTAMSTCDGVASYFEFSSRFANGQSIETNTNGILPLLPANPAIRVFRLESIGEPRALLRIHRQLTEKYAPGLCALGEPRDAEIQRYARTIEGVGPRLAESGDMAIVAGGGAFMLTWKGAVRTAWLGLWPVSLFRKIIHHHAMRLELQSLQTTAEAALQKA